jgi:hypothetical protein
MSSLRTATALAATAVSLAAAPAALAHTDAVGTASGTPNANVCVADIQCTYLNYAHGQPTDVVRHTGTIKSWKVNAASVGGTVRLRILRPAGHGTFKLVRSSALRTVADDGVNTFPASLKVRAGDVLGLTNSTSGLYMETADWSDVEYFNYDNPVSATQARQPNRSVPQLHALLSARVTR